MKREQLFLIVLILSCAVVFSLLTVRFQEKKLGGLPVLEEGSQIERHNAVIQGTAGSPWQYRILSEHIVHAVLTVFRKFEIPHANAAAFLSVRLFQNILIFILAFLFYRKLGIDVYAILIGLSFLAWGMTHATHDSGLSFNTYSDIIFYLTAGLIVLYKKHFLIIPLTILAAFNRETSGFIPLMIWANYSHSRTTQEEKNQLLKVSIVSMALFAAIFFGLRATYGMRPYITAHGGIYLGFGYLPYNLLRIETYEYLLATLGIIPLLALFSYRKWPHELKVFFWLIVPAWFFVHLFASTMAETRLFLVPYALIFIPGAVFGLPRKTSL